jgi:hypothetical protein
VNWKVFRYRERTRLTAGMARDDEVIDAGRRDHVCDRDGLFGLYRVVGDRATGKCEIVTRNPAVIGDIWLEDGPYGSLNDAKLTRSTTGRLSKRRPACRLTRA